MVMLRLNSKHDKLAKERMSYAKYFKPSELACRHCGVDGTKKELRDALDAFREKAGPTLINCAYRCPVHNAAVGGVPDSQHVLGLAADIRVPGATPAQLEAIARTIPAINGIGRADYQEYLHIDVRAEPAEWCYNKFGQAIDYTEVAG